MHPNFLSFAIVLSTLPAWMVNSNNLPNVGDFLLITENNNVSRMDFPTELITNPFPAYSFESVYAVDFDAKRNCLFWVDRRNGSIKRSCLHRNNSTEIMTIVPMAEIEDISYDWLTELLYFIDSKNFQIQLISTTDEKNLMQRKIFDTGRNSDPKGIVVHPEKGYLFYTDCQLERPSIMRTDLDGTNSRVLIGKPDVKWPNGITIDFSTNHVYWIDGYKRYIGRCDVNGDHFKEIIKNDDRIDVSFNIAVDKEAIYWDDSKNNVLYKATKMKGENLNITAVFHDSKIFDLKMVTAANRLGSNACQSGHNCTHICVGAPNGDFACLCPDGMVMTPAGQCACPRFLLYSDVNGKCPTDNGHCYTGEFECDNRHCIPHRYRCNGFNDCGDNSDEVNCTCEPLNFKCKSNHRCIPM